MERDAGENNAADTPQDLLFGITTWHVRILCDNPWEGGAGYTPEQVYRMTIDQILMRLTDKKLLEGKGKRGQAMLPMAAAALANKEGFIKGRAADGTPIKGRIAGKSLAKQLAEKAVARRAAEQKKKGD